mgnify:CR=1 FL=1
MLNEVNKNQKTAPHLSAEEIYNRLIALGEEVSLPTVYRVLAQFESAGLVKRHSFDGDRAVYEIDDGETHNHMVCVCCSSVAEFVDRGIAERLQQLAKDQVFIVSDYNIVLHGVCRDCKKV